VFSACWWPFSACHFAAAGGDGRPRRARRALAYKTLLIWPYAVAPAVAGVLWAFLFAPSIGIVTYVLKGMGRRLELDLLKGDQAMLLVVIAAVWKQISATTSCSSWPGCSRSQEPDRGRGHRRRRPHGGASGPSFPLLSPTTFFLLVVNIVYAFFDTFGIIDATTAGRPGQATADPGLQGLQRRRQGGRPRRLVGAVGDPDGDRHRADGRAVPLRRAQGATTDDRATADPLAAPQGGASVPSGGRVPLTWSRTTLAHASDPRGADLGVLDRRLSALRDLRRLHAHAEQVQVPMPLLPGDQFWSYNYSQVLGADRHGGSKAPVAPMMLVNSLVMALVIAIGKIAISHPVGLCHRLLPLPAAQCSSSG
jgi:hypothetical protein